MHHLVRKVGRIVREERLLAAGDCCVVGVSGGPDSMALLHVLSELAQGLGIFLVAAHADHGLRPQEAQAEADLVRQAVADLGWPCVCRSLPVLAHAREQGLSVEHAARNLRYEFLAGVAAEHGARKIALGHTADDQAEELLLRLIRGTGLAGLSGMEMSRDGWLIRPLLSTIKQELLEYLKCKNIAFSLDSSNLQRLYLRNRVRLDLLPLLEKEFNPNIRARLLDTAEILRAEEELLSGLADAAFASVLVAEKGGLAGLSLSLSAFDREPVALQRRILEHACWRMECRPSFRQIAQLLRLAVEPGGGGQLHLARGLRVRRQDGELVFSYPRGKEALRGNLATEEPSSFSQEIPGPGEYLLAGTGRKIVVEELAACPDFLKLQDRMRQCLDAASLSFPLVVRSFRPGDRFWPLGAPGRKKVGDFFTDQKIPKAERLRIPVLEDREGIVALLGLRPDRRCAPTAATCRFLTVTLHPSSASENGFTEKRIHGN